MTRIAIIVAALLSILGGEAATAETSERSSKRTQKLMATLDMLGLNAKEIKYLISEADTRIDNGYLNLSEHTLAGSPLILRVQLSSRKNIYPFKTGRGVELHYAPEETRWNVTARSKSIVARYRLELK